MALRVFPLTSLLAPCVCSSSAAALGDFEGDARDFPLAVPLRFALSLPLLDFEAVGLAANVGAFSVTWSLFAASGAGVVD